MREQGCRPSLMNPGEGFGRRTAAQGEWHETCAKTIEGQNIGDNRTVSVGIELHPIFPLSQSPMDFQMTKTALVLSGGGMFGAYQAGVWKALSHELSPDIVVGASVGALDRKSVV